MPASSTRLIVPCVLLLLLGASSHAVANPAKMETKSSTKAASGKVSVLQMSAAEQQESLASVQCNGLPVFAKSEWVSEKAHAALVTAGAALVARDVRALQSLIGQGPLRIDGYKVPRGKVRKRLRRLLASPLQSFGATEQTEDGMCWLIDSRHEGTTWVLETNERRLGFYMDSTGQPALRFIDYPSDDEC